MQLIPKCLRRKPKLILAPEPEELPKNTWDLSYVTSIHHSIVPIRLSLLDKRTMDCTDKMVYNFLTQRISEDYTPRDLVRDMQNGRLFPDFSLDDLALFFHRYIIK